MNTHNINSQQLTKKQGFREQLTLILEIIADPTFCGFIPQWVKTLLRIFHNLQIEANDPSQATLRVSRF